MRMLPADLLASHKLASQVKSQVNDVRVKSQVIYLNSKTSQNGQLESDSSQPLRLESTRLLMCVTMSRSDFCECCPSDSI